MRKIYFVGISLVCVFMFLVACGGPNIEEQMQPIKDGTILPEHTGLSFDELKALATINPPTINDYALIFHPSGSSFSAPKQKEAIMGRRGEVVYFYGDVNANDNITAGGKEDAYKGQVVSKEGFSEIRFCYQKRNPCKYNVELLYWSDRGPELKVGDKIELVGILINHTRVRIRQHDGGTNPSAWKEAPQIAVYSARILSDE